MIANLGVFVCSNCAGLHREMGNRAMGVGMSVFKEKDLETLEAMGNKRAKAEYLASYSKKITPVPDPVK